jgi:hypothetical protein
MSMNGSEYLWIKRRAQLGTHGDHCVKDVLALIDEVNYLDGEFTKLLRWAWTHNNDPEGLRQLYEEHLAGLGKFDPQNFPQQPTTENSEPAQFIHRSA